jgi:hypothetical protein
VDAPDDVDRAFYATEAWRPVLWLGLLVGVTSIYEMWEIWDFVPVRGVVVIVLMLAIAVGSAAALWRAFVAPS